MLIEELHLRGFLSYPPESSSFALRPLNVLIGPNGSGKSNILHALHFLRATAGDLWSAVRSEGETSEWVWQGPGDIGRARLEASVRAYPEKEALRYALEFAQIGGRFEVTDERIERLTPLPGKSEPYFLYRFQNGHPVLNSRQANERVLRREDINPQQSILTQRRDPDQYPELARIASLFGSILSYRGWPVTPDSPLRRFQRTDAPGDYLLEDAGNLALVLNRLSKDTATWRRLRETLRTIYEGIDDLAFDVANNSIRVMIREKWFVTPSTRLSDGTLRFLCLLAVLLDPKPAPLVCLDEPELGLHPDAIHEVSKLLLEARERMQLIVTTHSRELLDGLSSSPESVVVSERVDGASTLRRLETPELVSWLREYGVGRAWRDGELGGNRW